MKTLLKVLGCLGIVVLLLAAAAFWGLIKLFSPSPHVFLPTKDPNGRQAALSRPGGSMEPIYYGVFVDKPACDAAIVRGYKAEDWVRLAWTGPNALTVRYGLPQGEGWKAEAPKPATGEKACTDLKLTIVEDASLAPPPTLNRPGYSAPVAVPDDVDNLSAGNVTAGNVVENAQ